MAEHAEYESFVRSHGGALFRIAFLMCQDHHEAQDLVQSALAKIYTAWGRVQKVEHPEAYARQVLVRTFLSRRRRARVRELPLREDQQHPAAAGTDLDLRLTLLAALRRLPARNRAVVVLRYLEDHSIQDVATMLEISPAAVKSLNTRSLALLRESFGTDRTSLFHR